MISVSEASDSICVKFAAMDFDLRTLGLWEEAKAQGIDPSGGGSFGLDTRRFSLKQRREFHRHTDRFANGTQPKLYNYFRYPDGRVVGLDPLLEAVYRE